MKTLRLRNVGQIADANLAFGDLTVLIGPQASGKSITLQWLKLLLDTGLLQQQLHIASGKSAFSARDPQVKALALPALRFEGRHYAV